MKTITWMIDVDDTLGKLAEEWIYLYNKDHDDNLQVSDIKTWNIGSYTKIKNKMYEYLDLPYLYDNVQPEENALITINTIRNIFPNSIFIFCTHVTPGHAGQKYHWLKRNGFLQAEDQYFEGYSPSSIAKWLFNADIMIDDNIRHIKEFRGKLSILFNKPWNADYNHPFRVNNWKHFLEKLSEVEKCL